MSPPTRTSQTNMLSGHPGAGHREAERAQRGEDESGHRAGRHRELVASLPDLVPDRERHDQHEDKDADDLTGGVRSRSAITESPVSGSKVFPPRRFDTPGRRVGDFPSKAHIADHRAAFSAGRSPRSRASAARRRRGAVERRTLTTDRLAVGSDPMVGDGSATRLGAVPMARKADASRR
jgi:hypothetical protein